MDFRRLRYFVAVADHLNFRRAADALNTSQPSLSQQIGALEAELGFMLFERSKRQVRLTAAGAEYLAGVRSLLSEFEWCAQRARDAQLGKRGTVAVGANGMVMFKELPLIVRSFSEEFPEVRISLSVLRNPDPIRALRAQRIDLALTTQNEQHDDVERQKLWALPWRVVIPSDHPLAKNDRVRLSKLSGETLLVAPHREGPGGYEEMLAVCREHGFVPRSIHEISEIAPLETIIGLVAAGLGVALLPSTYEQIKFPTVSFKPITASKSESHVSICWRKNETNPSVHQFIRIARDMASSPVRK